MPVLHSHGLHASNTKHSRTIWCCSWITSGPLMDCFYYASMTCSHYAFIVTAPRVSLDLIMLSLLPLLGFHWISSWCGMVWYGGVAVGRHRIVGIHDMGSDGFERVVATSWLSGNYFPLPTSTLRSRLWPCSSSSNRSCQSGAYCAAHQLQLISNQYNL